MGRSHSSATHRLLETPAAMSPFSANSCSSITITKTTDDDVYDTLNFKRRVAEMDACGSKGNLLLHNAVGVRAEKPHFKIFNSHGASLTVDPVEEVEPSPAYLSVATQSLVAYTAAEPDLVADTCFSSLGNLGYSSRA